MENIPNLQYGKTSQAQQVPGLDVTIRLCCRPSQRAKFQCLDLESGPTPEWYEAEALISLGACTTPNISEQHSGAGVCSLSAILEENVPGRYSLSPRACAGILRRAERRGRDLPPMLRAALEERAGKLCGIPATRGIADSGTYCIAGNILGRQEHNGGNGIGYREGASYALTATDRHAVAVPTVALRMRSGCEGGGKGPLFQVEKSGTLATGNDQCLFIPQTAVEILNDQGGKSMSIEQAGISPTLRSQTHGNLPVIASVLCVGTGQMNAGIADDRSPTLTAAHEQPFLLHPHIGGDLCAVSEGLSYKAGSASGSVGHQAETAPTLLAGQRGDVLRASPDVSAIDGRNDRETDEISGTLQAKASSGGHSLNDQDPIRIGFCVRRLTPLEAERLQGFPDYWTECDDKGDIISDTKRYQMLGNSVAVPCVAYIMQGIANVLRNRQ